MGTRERKIKERRGRRIQILSAARKVLLEKGIKATSISQIAREAELGVGTIYFYFRSKEALFAALQAEGLALLNARIQQACAQADAASDKIRGMAAAYRDFSSQEKNYFAVINYFLSAPDIILSPDLKSQIDTHGNRILGNVRKSLEDGIAAGQFRENIDVRRTAVAFWGLLHGLVQFRKLQDTIIEGGQFGQYFNCAVENFLLGLNP